MFNKFFVLVGVGAVLSLGSTGCSTTPTTNEICLIENQRVNVDQVSIGLQHAGYEIKLLSADEDRSGCARCVEYGLVFNEKRDAVESVVFRSTKNGQVEKQVRGPTKDGGMTLRQVAFYAAEFSLLLKKMDEAAENSDSEYYFLNFPKNLHSNTGTGDYFPKKVISS